MSSKLIYQFSQKKTDGDKTMSDLLGGKGANLAEMSNLGINVPPGFTVTTEVCNYFIENKSFPENFDKELRASVKKLEDYSGKVFGTSENPLLLSVRSGGRISMPGMMDTVLNLGLNDKTVEALSNESGDSRFAYDSYRRFIQMYGDVVMGVQARNEEEEDPQATPGQSVPKGKSKGKGRGSAVTNTSWATPPWWKAGAAGTAKWAKGRGKGGRYGEKS